MSDHKGYFTTDSGHALPVDDEIEHVPYDWCECNPELWVVNGKEMWLHEAADQRNILDQAEAIRQCTSFDIFQEKRHTYDPENTQLYTFTDRTYFVWPRTANRNNPENKD